RFKPKGLLLSEPEVIHAMDQSLSSGYSDIIPVAVKADGSFYRNASVFTQQQWGSMQKFLSRKIQEIGTGMTEGHVDISPSKIGNKVPCTYCRYHAICQFDPSYEDNA